MTTCFKLIRLNFVLLHACSCRINLKGKKEVYASEFCLDDECWRSFEEKVHGILSKGLNDRVKLVRVIWRNTQSNWRIDDVWD